MSQDLKKQLISAGFSETEAQVYLALLPQSAMTVQELTNVTDLPRSTVALALEKLVRAGVINEYVYGKRRNFVVQSPEDVIRYAEAAEAELAVQKSSLTALVGLVKHHHFLQAVSGIKVEILKGADSLKDIYERTLAVKKGDEILRLGVEAEKFVFIPEYLRTYRLEKNRRGIKTRLLIPESPMGKEVCKHDDEDKRETRLLPRSVYSPDAAIVIWNNTLAMTIWNDRLETIVIESKSLVDIFRSIYELLWKSVKK